MHEEIPFQNSWFQQSSTLTSFQNSSWSVLPFKNLKTRTLANPNPSAPFRRVCNLIKVRSFCKQRIPIWCVCYKHLQQIKEPWSGHFTRAMVFSLLMIHPSFGGLFGNINCMKIYRICRIQDDSEASTSSCLPSLGPPPHRLGRWITSFWYLELYWFIGDAATNFIVGRTWFWSTSVHILRVLLVNSILWFYHLAAATIVEVRAPVFAVPWSHCVAGGVCAHSLQIIQTNKQTWA